MSKTRIQLLTRSPERTGRDSLFVLYRPLCGQDALILYEVLTTMVRFQDRTDQEELFLMSGLGTGRLEKARKNLEMFGLLDVFEDPVSGGELYVVNLPLDPSRFLHHQVFSRLLLNTVGSDWFDRLMQLFAQPVSIPEGYLRKTEEIDTEPLERQWTDAKEEKLLKMLPARDQSGFDWDKFYEGRDYLFPVRMRTRANEELIANLARLYGLSEIQMVKYVSRACPPPLRILDCQALESIVRSERRREIMDHADPFDNAPVLFLQERQKGAPVSEADRRLLEKLAGEYRFAAPVINELLDYTMEQTGGALPTAYVEKVAGTWSRLGLDSRDKVREWRQRQKEETGSRSSPVRRKTVKSGSIFSGQLPAWYSDKGRQFSSEEERRKMLEEIDEIRKNRNL